MYGISGNKQSIVTRWDVHSYTYKMRGCNYGSYPIRALISNNRSESNAIFIDNGP